MMLDDVIGSDRDEFPLEQVLGLGRSPTLEEDWDDATEAVLGLEFAEIVSVNDRWEPLSG